MAVRPRVGAWHRDVERADTRIAIGTDECLLQACIPIDWTKPVAVFEARPCDYKLLKAHASGVLQLTVEISDGRHRERSPSPTKE